MDHRTEDVGGTDTAQFRSIGMICYIYGSFICLLMLIPNPIQGRLSFLFCGGFVILVGKLLKWSAQMIDRKASEKDLLKGSEATAAK